MKRLAYHPRRSKAPWAIGSLVLIALATNVCGRAPTSPTGAPGVPATPAAPATSSLVVTGIVSGDGLPLGGAFVEVRGARGVDYWRIDARADATGRYRVEKNDSGPTTVWVTAHHDQFKNQPCAVWFDYSPAERTERTADVSLTASANSSGRAQTPMPGRRGVSGTVYSFMPAGKQAVSGANVYMDLFESEVVVQTTTDVEGRFILCELPADRHLQILGYLFIAPYQALQGWSVLAPGGDVDIELIVK